MAKTQIDERTKKVLQEYLPEGYPKDDAVWPLERGGKVVCWIAKHKALELMAAKAGVIFEMPVMVENNAKEKTAVIIVRGKLKEAQEWSFGEAASYNNKNEYPFAMAEKRAKDRVILKLLGLHGDVYSEEEADEFKQLTEKPNKLKNDPDVQDDIYDNLLQHLEVCSDLDELTKWATNHKAALDDLSEKLKTELRNKYRTLEIYFKEKR